MKKNNERKETTAEKKSTTTVVVQPVVVGSTKLNSRGVPYINGKKLATAVISLIPAYCCGASAGNDVADCINYVKKNETGKGKVVAKTVAKCMVKCVAGVLSSQAVQSTIENSFDLN